MVIGKILNRYSRPPHEPGSLQCTRYEQQIAAELGGYDKICAGLANVMYHSSNKSPMYVCMYSTHTRVSDRALSPLTYASFAFSPLHPPPPSPLSPLPPSTSSLLSP